ncbi:GlsB/YeaQ/YmgE family stress response membrane protein [Flavilitoribacter nigricans]|uniref:GlsB/YeaQ/YmgE family stress response membrane protein n=1 Tax=Flavilitoribacter nigricans (strain ATCC 23147 / DSM 23189 / NBRC 102662 / NCIMB 1420 / SS-2) TaxID=1122177 RepID=A0A2D0N1F2_FLAN2|nr:GlsB/YeaQ/YmgE family stress response membrane protein [Flavilitoribacter nigricans]PHN02344.1 GlsB/YeaQ/YmgE family stress response membrane protein [Flavilitoribacter nigricans DSM 23189 = NBRC 102662]
MDAGSLLIILAIGAIAGWIAGNLMRGGGFGLVWNIILGIVGSIVGSWLLGQLGVAAGAGILGSLITSVIGAVVILFIASLIKR